MSFRNKTSPFGVDNSVAYLHSVHLEPFCYKVHEPSCKVSNPMISILKINLPLNLKIRRNNISYFIIAQSVR